MPSITPLDILFETVARSYDIIKLKLCWHHIDIMLLRATIIKNISVLYLHCKEQSAWKSCSKNNRTLTIEQFIKNHGQLQQKTDHYFHSFQAGLQNQFWKKLEGYQIKGNLFKLMLSIARNYKRKSNEIKWKYQRYFVRPIHTKCLISGTRFYGYVVTQILKIKTSGALIS